MLEVIVAGLLVAVAVFAIGNTGKPAGETVTLEPSLGSDDAPGLDLPCPWCLGQTEEQDEFCRSCGQRFG